MPKQKTATPAPPAKAATLSDLFFAESALQQFRDGDFLNIDEDSEIMAMLEPAGGKCKTGGPGSPHGGKSKSKGHEGMTNLGDIL